MAWAKIQYLACRLFPNAIQQPGVFHLAKLAATLFNWAKREQLIHTVWSIFNEVLFAMDDRHLTTRSWDYELSKQQLQPKEHTG
jgi:hypothetical protein